MRSPTNPPFPTLRAVIAAILGALIAPASATDSTVPKPLAESSTDRENPAGADKSSGIWQTDYKQALAQAAQEGFPTYVLLNPAGTEMRRQLGYLEGGPKEFIKWAQSGN
jgi:hypothetical protein